MSLITCPKCGGFGTLVCDDPWKTVIDCDQCSGRGVVAPGALRDEPTLARHAARRRALETRVGDVEEIRKRVYGTTPLTAEAADEQNRQRVLLAEIDRLRAALAEQRERDAQIAECFGGEGWVSERGRGYADAARRIAAAIRRGDA